jgi:hypothetical protein
VAPVTLLLTAAVLGFVGFRLATAARYTLGPGRAMARRVVAGIGWPQVLAVPVVLGGVLAVALVLVQWPPLAWGWWSALGGEGNPVFGATGETEGTWLAWAVPAVFIVMLAPAVPLLALREEEIFRHGAERWSWPERAGRCVLFGLAHALIGIPIGVALALSVGGAYFLAVYLRAHRRSGSARLACLESASAHTAYNWTILAVVAAAFAAEAVLTAG